MLTAASAAECAMRIANIPDAIATLLQLKYIEGADSGFFYDPLEINPDRTYIFRYLK